MINPNNYWYDEYGNACIKFSDGTIIGGAIAEDYLHRQSVMTASDYTQNNYQEEEGD